MERFVLYVLRASSRARTGAVGERRATAFHEEAASCQPKLLTGWFPIFAFPSCSNPGSGTWRTVGAGRCPLVEALRRSLSSGRIHIWEAQKTHLAGSDKQDVATRMVCFHPHSAWAAAAARCRKESDAQAPVPLSDARPGRRPSPTGSRHIQVSRRRGGNVGIPSFGISQPAILITFEPRRHARRAVSRRAKVRARRRT